MDSNVTRKGLLALKDSKPVPITAHSHEIVIPCVYTETVKKMMKAKGIELPLTHAKLAELRKIAKATPGHYEADKEKEGGSSHAKGTMNVIGKKNQATQQIAKQTQKVQIFLDRRTGRKKTRRPRTIASMPTVQGGPQMFNPPAYNMIRPFVANTPMGYHPSPVRSEELVKAEKEKDLASQLQREEALQRRTNALEALVRRSEELEQNARRNIERDLVSSSSWSQPSTPSASTSSIDFPTLEVPHKGPSMHVPIAEEEPEMAPIAEEPEEVKEEEVAAQPAFSLSKDDCLHLLDEIHEWEKGRNAQAAMEMHASQIMGINLRNAGRTFEISKRKIERLIRRKIEELARGD